MSTKRNLKMSDVKNVDGNKRRTGVTNFSDYAGEEIHKRFDQLIDSTIYIVKLEIMTSETYGAGWKVYFKDLPGEHATYDCSVFGTYPCQQLQNLYDATNEGRRISLDSPIRTVIRAAGKSYKFE